jgi:hypothetical protein
MPHAKTANHPVRKPTLADPLTDADIAKLPMADVRRLYKDAQGQAMYHEANDRLYLQQTELAAYNQVKAVQSRLFARVHKADTRNAKARAARVAKRR